MVVVAIVKVSLPAPPSTLSTLSAASANVSLPSPPMRVSLPVPPVIWSLPASPVTLSLPPPPSRVSAPAPPAITSALPPPVKVSLPAPPVIVDAKVRAATLTFAVDVEALSVFNDAAVKAETVSALSPAMLSVVKSPDVIDATVLAPPCDVILIVS